MSTIHIKDIFIYPIKSTKGQKVDDVKINQWGIENDRKFAIINKKNIVITARENPQLLKLSIHINKDQITISSKSKYTTSFHLSEQNFSNQALEISLFGKTFWARQIQHSINQWLSTAIDEPCSLVQLDDNNLRKIDAKFNSFKDKAILFTDAAPIHLISEASFDYINSKLEEPVLMEQFRPNIVITGVEPFEEDQWNTIEIDGIKFDFMSKTGRCSLTTIDTETVEQHEKQEPLRTLALERSENNQINFGVYYVPRNEGFIKTGASVIIDI